MAYKKGKPIKTITAFLLLAAVIFSFLQNPLLAEEVFAGTKEGELYAEREAKKVKTLEAEKISEMQELTDVEENQEKEQEEAAEEIVQVQDLKTFAQNVNEKSEIPGSTEQEALAVNTPSEDFLGRCLLIMGDVNLQELGVEADTVLKGYENLTVLFFETEDDTRDAYTALKEKGIPVEINVPMAPDSVIEEKSIEKKAEVQMGEAVETAGSEVVVAVLDSGYDHASYGEGRIVSGTDLTGSDGIMDENGHGTAMAGIILEHTKEQVKVMPVKVADASGCTTALHIYMGMMYAIEQGADIINISMSAYKSDHSAILQKAAEKAFQQGIIVVVSAGNQGEDIKDYTPANIESVLTVSAVNADKVRDEYSNYGEGVDYCAYGSMEVTGLSGNKAAVSGTSVSAAVVSGMAAAEKSNNPQMSRDELLHILDGGAEDLGDKGKDIYYGRGFLAFDSMKAKEEGSQIGEKPELLTCDWKSLPDTDLNRLIAAAKDIDKKRFLDDLSGEDKEELLGRKEILFNHRHTEVVREINEDYTLGEEKKFQGTLYEYLYSQFFQEFSANGSASQKHNGESQSIHISATSQGTYFVNLTTSQNQTPAQLSVWINGYTKNPTKKYTLHASATDAGAYGFSGLTVKTNNKGAIYDITVGGIQVSKTAHTTLKNHFQTRYYVKGDPDYKEEESGDGGLGGFRQPGSESCASTVQPISFLFSHNDGEHSSSNGNYALTYQLNFKKPYGTTPGAWGPWSVLIPNTCTNSGIQVQSRQHICNNCGLAAKEESQQGIIPAHGHNFADGAWEYGTSPVTGVERGMRYRQCTYNCNEAGWRINYEYLNEIYYRAMNSDGSYPQKYTRHSSGYYPQGTVIPGYTYNDTNGSTSHRSTTLPSYTSFGYALLNYVDIPRKEYTIKYHGNGNDGGGMKEQKVFFGQKFSLFPNGFVKKGYDCTGYNTREDGSGDAFLCGQRIEKNLINSDRGIVNLYAQWTPHIYTITLDNQGAAEEGTKTVYQKYITGYYQDKEAKEPFTDNKIVIPQKTVKDDSLIKKQRKQLFLGYFTKKKGQGYAMIKRDGSLIADINHAGNYCFFTEDASVYAFWQDMYAVQYVDNLTEEDKKAVGEEENILPEIKWKEQGKELTLNFETAELANEDFKKIYRLKGWSLTPEIKGDEELVLSQEKTSYTLTEDKDVILYAQWDSSFRAAYTGNGQTMGEDYFETAESAAKNYTFSSNKKEGLSPGEETDYFEKFVEKDTIDIATGDSVDEGGRPCKEMIPCSFLGWSMYSDEKEQKENPVYCIEDGEWESRKIILDGIERSKKTQGQGLTFDAPTAEYKGFDESQKVEGMPYVNMYAVWDEFPQILAHDLYIPLRDAREGVITQEYLLDYAKAVDKELQGVTDEAGSLSHGTDRVHNTLFSVEDYQAEDFTNAQGDMSMTITYCAKDTVGNTTEKMVNVYLVDTGAREYSKGKVRFISEEYVDTLSEKSVWRTAEYASVLNEVLKISKSGEEYTNPSAIEQLLGAEPVKKPGSGTWNQVMQVWKFTHEQVIKAQEFMEHNGIQGTQQEFLQQFGSCRIQ